MKDQQSLIFHQNKRIEKQVEKQDEQYEHKASTKQVNFQNVDDTLENDNTYTMTMALASPNDLIGQKRRGRKRERDDLYFIKAQQRIRMLKTMLKTAKEDGLSVKERQRLRNQVSAQ
jgi:hypothetical protein